MYEFKDAEYMTAEEKKQVIKQWTTFLKNGCQFKNFSKRLYSHLTLHCSFIAHYDRYGFYDTYFLQPEDTKRFLSQFDPNGEMASIEYGGSWWQNGDYSDLNQAMCMIAGEYIEEIVTKTNKDERERDLAQADALLRKHGINTEM